DGGLSRSRLPCARRPDHLFRYRHDELQCRRSVRAQGWHAVRRPLGRRYRPCGNTELLDSQSQEVVMQLFVHTLKSTLIGLVVFGFLIFAPAGTFTYWQGWAFIAVFSLSTTIIGVYLALKDPVLLERRMKIGPAAETRPVQKLIISLSFAVFFILIVVSVLDHRFGWSHVPAWVSVAGNVLVALGLMLDLDLLRASSFGA